MYTGWSAALQAGFVKPYGRSPARVVSVVFVRCREVLARVDAGAAVARERVGALARREEAVAAG